jgi:protease I
VEVVVVAEQLSGKRIAFFAAPEGTEQVELTEPWEAFERAGAELTLLSTEPGEIQMFNHLELGETWKVDRTVGDATSDEFDGLVLPGGAANADKGRMDPSAVRFVKSFFDAGKPAAVICHAPWLLVEADVVRGRTVTSYPSLRTDIRNAGGHWLDKEVVVDRGLVTSRRPADLKAFIAKAIEEFAEGTPTSERKTA